MALGTGFNVELSGRENIRVGGLCLGMSHSEIARKESSIIAFSELAEFIDRPCRTYSSGMLMRLAFSVASSCEPNILIIDEALAVGDAPYVAKSYGRMRELARSGAAVLFVSHNLSQLYDLCTSAILLEDGVVAAQGDARAVGERYDRTITHAYEHAIRSSLPQGEDVAIAGAASAKAGVLKMRVLDGDASAVRLLRGGECYAIEIQLDEPRLRDGALLRVAFLDRRGFLIGGMSRRVDSSDASLPVHIGFRCDLNSGAYELVAHVAPAEVAPDATWIEDAAHYSIEALHSKAFIGFVDLNATVRRIS